jgi:PGF-pre-PGF domain-containing protein
MTKKIKTTFFLFIVFFLVCVSASLAAEGSEVGTWYGIAYVNDLRAGNSTYVAAHLNASSSAVNSVRIGQAEVCLLSNCTGFYYINVQANASYNVTYKICGIATNVTAPAWSAGAHSQLDLFINKSASGASCTYSCGCSGGYCCSGATEYTTGSGTGTCQASACSGGGSTSTGGTGGTAGGTAAGGAATTTTTTAAATTATTTTIAPPVVESATVQTVTSGEAAVFKYEKITLGISEITITTKSTAASASNVQIEITKTTTTPTTISIAAPNIVYAYLDIKATNIATADIENAKIKFHVEKSWVDANNINISTITMNRYVDGAWTALPTTSTSFDGTSYYFEAISPGLSVFAITAEKIAIPTTTTIPPITLPPVTDWATIIITIFIIIAIIFFAWKAIQMQRKHNPQQSSV